MDQESLVQSLLNLQVDEATARCAAEASSSLQEAQAMARDPLGAVYKEYFCLKYQRLYYADDTAGTSWEPPPPLLLREWRTDASVYGISVRQARNAYEALQAVLSGSEWAVALAALRLAAKIAGNVVDCGNQESKFRAVKLSNPAFAARCWPVPGMPALLRLAGFEVAGERVLHAEGPVTGIEQALVSRMRRIVDGQGHTGACTDVDNTAAAGPGARWRGTPGFRYQRDIYECSVCAAPINDGSERLYTRAHDAPHGEFRFACTTCEGFHLCEACWDRYQKGDALHPREHPFEHIGPHMQRHGLNRRESSANPWGMQTSGGFSARSRQRLQERTGL